MKKHLHKLIALAATARIANIPSVVSNVTVGCVLALGLGDVSTGQRFSGQVVCLILTAVCLYLAGNFLNDWADRKWDMEHRPERALPRGLFRPRSYLIASLGLGCLAFLSAFSVGSVAITIAATIAFLIAIYTWLHKRSSWSVIPMGMCRALLPLLGFAPLCHGGLPNSKYLPASAAALALFAYIVGLSLSARNESARELDTNTASPAWLLFLLPPALIFPITVLHLGLPLYACTASLLPYFYWTALCITRYRTPVSAHVSCLLAGIPMVDSMLLFPIGLTLIACMPDLSPLILTCLIVPPAAVVAGRALQRLAPAT